MGDGLLAYFGYPTAAEDGPIRAVQAGLAVVENVQSINVAAGLKVCVGLATGPVLVGDIVGEGASKRLPSWARHCKPGGAAAGCGGARHGGVVRHDNAFVTRANGDTANGAAAAQGFAEPVSAYRAVPPIGRGRGVNKTPRR